MGPNREDGLECVVNGRPVAVAVAAVDRLIEYQVSPPPPLAQPWVGGLGVEAGEVFVSLRLARTGATSPARKGVLFVARGSAVRWTLEVDAVKGVVDVETAGVLTERDGSWTCPLQWIVPARSGGRAVSWLDVDGVEAALRAQGGR